MLEDVLRMEKIIIADVGADIDDKQKIKDALAYEDGDEQPNNGTISAMLEARSVLHDPAAKTYSSIDELFKDLDM